AANSRAHRSTLAAALRSSALAPGMDSRMGSHSDGIPIAACAPKGLSITKSQGRRIQVDRVGYEDLALSASGDSFTNTLFQSLRDGRSVTLYRCLASSSSGSRRY